jgi:hypothetical protein
MLCCLAVAWFNPARKLARRWIWPVAQVSPGESQQFIALAYTGVSDRDNEVKKDQFRRHLRALKAAGYVPIGLKDVQGLLKDGKDLPPRAVLLTFDHGRRSSYFAVKGILREVGWKAVMFLWTKPILDKDASSLLWPYVQGMLENGQWEIGSQSHLGFEKVQATSSGQFGHYMTTVQWLSKEARFETADEFRTRIETDYQKSLNNIEQGTGVRPLAYAYPYGDFGQTRRQASVVRNFNMAMVAKYYQLGFLSGNFGLNTRFSDPLRLNRLQISATWTAEELVARLERLWAGTKESAPVELEVSDKQWIVDEGALTIQDQELFLSAEESSTGARLWLAGSDLRQDFYAKGQIHLQTGQFGVYMRASPDQERYVYLGIDPDGNAWLRQKRAWGEPFTLASAQLTLAASQKHQLELFVRDRLFYALLDGRAVFEKRVELTGEPDPGMIGLSVWHPEERQARASVCRLTVNPQHPTLVWWTPGNGPQDENHAVKWLHENAYRLTDISPPLPRDGSGAESNMALFRLLAKIYHLRIIPRFDAGNVAQLELLPPNRLAERVQADNCDGLLLAISESQGRHLTAIATWLQKASIAFDKKNLRFLVHIMPGQVPVQDLQRLQVAPNIQLAVPALISEAQAKRLDVPFVRAEELPAPNSPHLASLPTQVLPSPKVIAAEQNEATVKRLQKEAAEAYSEARYSEAIALWGEWHHAEPNNAQPLMLMGDAHLRLNQSVKALDYYRQSLALDPSQIRLAIRLANLLDQCEDHEAARNLLNTYARLYSANLEVILAQAQWCERRGQIESAKKLMGRLLCVEPAYFPALKAKLRLVQTPEERRQVLQTLLDLPRDSDFFDKLETKFWHDEVLSLPEAHAFIGFLKQVSQAQGMRPGQPTAQELVPRVKSIEEDLLENMLSDAWQCEGGAVRTNLGVTTLVAAADRSEVSLMLSGTDRYRNAFLEVAVDHIQGSFWIYARRGGKHYVRFGVEPSGNCFLQLVRNGETLESKILHLGDKLTGRLQLRLQIKGNGAEGLVNGQMVFKNPLTLPTDFELGQFGLSVYAKKRGTARAVLEKINAGLLPVHLAVISNLECEEGKIDVRMSALRQNLAQISHLSLPAFNVGPYGNWVALEHDSLALYRLFARYYNLRIWPAVRIPEGVVITPADVMRVAQEHQVSGFVLCFGKIPSEDWFQRLSAELRLSPLEVVVMNSTAEQAENSIRILGAARDWFQDFPERKPIDSLSLTSLTNEQERLKLSDPLVLTVP